jgi:hypothetical protein
MKTKTRRIASAALVLAGLIAGLGYWLFSRMDWNLMDSARRVAVLPDSSQTSQADLVGWLDEHRMLACTYDAKWLQHLTIIDTRSGAKTSLPKLEKVLREIGIEASGILSPNGQWLIYLWRSAKDGTLTYYAVRLDGSQVHRLPTYRKGLSLPTWSSDSKGGVFVDYHTGGLVKWSLSDTILTYAAVHPHTSPSKPVDLDSYDLGPVTGGYLFYNDRHSEGPINLTRLDEQGNQQDISPIQIPRGGISESMSLSSDQQSLLWVVRYETKPSESRLMRTFNSWFHLNPGRFDSLWISNTDGTNLHELGYVQTDYNARQITGAGWTKDDKRIWFEYDNTIFTLPVK